MSEHVTAEEWNATGNRLRDDGDVAGAERAYRSAVDAAPEWSAPAYNLGLLCKYAGRWEESVAWNLRATELEPDDEGSWWNLGIAATATGDWATARRAWVACGIDMPPGDGPPDLGWGVIPVRLDPIGHGEVVWADRIDPARARIANIPLPTSSYRWGDVVLTDGAADGERTHRGRTYPVLNVLERLVPSDARTFVIELATKDAEAIATLERLAGESGGAGEDWGTFTRILCHDCSHGRPHEHDDAKESPAHPHCGLAARDHDHAARIIEAWLDAEPKADLVTWYEAPDVH
jgi:hypothetical protein